MAPEKHEFEVTRESTIPAPAASVFDLLVDFHRWTEWSPWEDIDPGMRRTYSGADAGVGAVYEWDGNRKAGAGRMEITESDPPSHLEIALQFLAPFKSKSTTFFDLAPAGDGTRVTWRMIGPKTFVTRVMGIFMSMDKMIGRDFEKGLTRLGEAAQRPV